MIDILFEQRIAHNAGFGAEVIWHAANEAFVASGKTNGLPLSLVFIVLPIAFHKRSAASLASKNQPGALYKALAENREIPVGLQERMETLASRTCEALDVAFRSGLLALDSNKDRHLIPIRKTPPVEHAAGDLCIALAAAKRIGQAISEMTMVQLTTNLNIKF